MKKSLSHDSSVFLDRVGDVDTTKIEDQRDSVYLWHYINAKDEDRALQWLELHHEIIRRGEYGMPYWIAYGAVTRGEERILADFITRKLLTVDRLQKMREKQPRCSCEWCYGRARRWDVRDPRDTRISNALSKCAQPHF